MISFNINNKANLEQLIKLMTPKIMLYKYHIFIGDVGVGKTFIIKFILQQIGINPEDITSPTFNYSRILHSHFGNVMHVDLYNIEKPAKAIEIMEDEDNIVLFLIEWGGILLPHLPDKESVVQWKILESFNSKTLQIDKNLI